jgi:hypothetical protein
MEELSVHKVIFFNWNTSEMRVFFSESRCDKKCSHRKLHFNVKKETHKDKNLKGPVGMTEHLDNPQ